MWAAVIASTICNSRTTKSMWSIVHGVLITVYCKPGSSYNLSHSLLDSLAAWTTNLSASKWQPLIYGSYLSAKHRLILSASRTRVRVVLVVYYCYSTMTASRTLHTPSAGDIAQVVTAL